MSTPDPRGMLDRADIALLIRRQRMLLGIARSGLYRPPRPTRPCPIGGSTSCLPPSRSWLAANTTMLKAEGLQVNRKRVQRLMRKLGHCGAWTKAEHDDAGAELQDLSLSVAQRSDQDLHGWPRSLDGQRLHRAAVAVAQARGHLSQRIYRRPRGQGRGHKLVS